MTRMQVLDVLTFLPDQILTKVDRASMAVGLEARVPLLDHRVVAFALGLRRELKIRAGVSKGLLGQVLYRHVPLELVERPKQGFSVPLATGFAARCGNGLRNSSTCECFARKASSRFSRLWHAHRTGRQDWSTVLWNILMSQSWLYRCGTATTRPDYSSSYRPIQTRHDAPLAVAGRYDERATAVYRSSA